MVYSSADAREAIPAGASGLFAGKRETYWPEIDGLRTLAVISVFLFHLDPRLLQGGFVGVDVFFVISGYLITGLLIKDIAAGNFSILRFYQRRIARIVPAAFLVIAATMIAGYFLYSAQDFSFLGADAVAATLSLINMKQLHDGSAYFAISPDAQPLFHYWSLAVEEQFYVFFPIMLYCVTRVTRHVLATFLICCLLSCAVCVLMTSAAANAAFYLLPTRAWELFAGASLAIAKTQYPKFADKHATPYLLVGVALILVSFVLVRSEDFPGWIAMVPVAGSTLALAGIETPRGGIIHRFLAHPAMVFIGKRSYSLYLWHWPIFSFVDYHFYMSAPAFGLALKVIISIAATVLTYRLVERPARLWLNMPRRRIVAFGAFAILATLLSITGYFVRYAYYLSAETRNVATGGISINPEGRGWVVLIGDSDGAMYGYELASLARMLGFRLNILSVVGAAELPGERDTLWPQVSLFLGDKKPDAIILAQKWSAKFRENDEEHFGEAIAILSHRTSHIVVLTEPPMLPPDATRHKILAGARPPFFEDPVTTQGRIHTSAFISQFASSRTRILEVRNIFLNSDNSIKLIASNGALNFQDSYHLSNAGTALVRPSLEQALREALPPRGAQ